MKMVHQTQRTARRREKDFFTTRHRDHGEERVRNSGGLFW